MLHPLDILAWVWRPFLMPSWIYLLVALSMGLSVWATWRSAKRTVAGWLLLSVRCLAIGAVGVLLMGPSDLLQPDSQNIKSNLYVLADVSESMETSDCAGNSRLETMKRDWFSSTQYTNLQQNFHTSFYGFADDVVMAGGPQGLTIAADQNTQLANSLRRVISSIHSEEKHARILLLSDGIDSDESNFGPVTRLARSKSVAVDTVLFGQQSFEPDIALVAVPMQEYLFPNESGHILARVYQTGCKDETTVLKVQQGPDVQRFPISFDGRTKVNIKVPIEHPDSGQFEYRLSVEPAESETETGNNDQTVFASVQPQKMKVILVEGQPFWDTKFIAQSLRKDGRLELTQISQISRKKRETIVTRGDGTTGEVPTTAADWSKFDVVIFGKNIEQMLTVESVEGLVQHVGNTGGNVIFARGQPSDPSTGPGRAIQTALQPLTPVTWTDQVVTGGDLQLTVAGKISQLFSPTKMGLDVDMALQRLPGFKTVERVAVPRANTQVLIETQAVDGDEIQNLPAIVLANHGAGSTVAILGAGMWKWSLLAPENQDLAGFYDAFWSNLVRWLIVGSDFQPGEQMALKINRTSVKKNHPLTVSVVLKNQIAGNAQPKLTVTLPSGESQTIALTESTSSTPRFEAEFYPVETGVHELHVAATGVVPDQLSQKFNVYDLNEEKLNIAAQPMKMRILANETGGKFYSWEEYDKFVQQVDADKIAQQVPPKTQFIWDQSWVMILLLSWCGIEWIGRRWIGLV